ncbi:Uncharacterised protein [Candidatus Tiddalikarchaeum anstoanum]|nr:Uncharacterised protein [Candidatus Tiddalikarchaeum anstoanum]
MNVVKIFVQDTCPNCPPSKELGKELAKKGLNVEVHNIRTPDGLAESLMHDILSTPSTVVFKNGVKVKSYLGITPKIDELLEALT